MIIDSVALSRAVIQAESIILHNVTGWRRVPATKRFYAAGVLNEQREIEISASIIPRGSGLVIAQR